MEVFAMTSVLSESILSLNEATKYLPPINGKRPCISTLWRWCLRGVAGGVRLEHGRLGGRIVTSKEALDRFATAVAERRIEEVNRVVAPAPVLPKSRSAKQRQRDIEAASCELAAMGV